MLKRYSQSRGCFCTLHETLTYAAGVNVHVDLCTTVHGCPCCLPHRRLCVQCTVRVWHALQTCMAPCMNRMPTAAVCVSGQGLP